MKLENRVGSLYQTKGEIKDVKSIGGDYRADTEGQPFAMGYFRMPSELPIAWESSMETGTV